MYSSLATDCSCRPVIPTVSELVGTAWSFSSSEPARTTTPRPVLLQTRPGRGSWRPPSRIESGGPEMSCRHRSPHATIRPHKHLPSASSDLSSADGVVLRFDLRTAPHSDVSRTAQYRAALDIA